MSKSNQNQIENLTQSIKKLEVKTDKILSKLDESFEEYTPKELEYLDKYQEFTNGLFEDEELYEIISKHNFDDAKIKRDVQELMKYMKKSDEYSWKKIEGGKGKII
jgi:hypothetical protein